MKDVTLIPQKTLHFIAIALIAAFLLPYYYYGQDVAIHIHDNLDSGLPSFKALMDSGMVTAPGSALLPNVMNGHPRVGFPSEYSLFYVLMVIFSPFWAYVVNLTLIKFVAYTGMHLFLSYKFRAIPKIIIAAVALGYALLPFFPMAQLSVASVPLAFYIFANFRDGVHKWWHWLVLALLPFATSLFFVYVFVLMIIGSVFIYDLFKTKKVNWQIVGGSSLLLIGFLFVEQRMIGYMLQPYFISNRVDFDLPTTDFWGIFREFKKIITRGHYHVASVPRWPFWAWVLAGLIFLHTGFKKRTWSRDFIKYSLICAAIGFFYAVWGWRDFSEFKNHFFLTRVFNFSRFHWLLPFFVSALFAVSLNMIWRKPKWGRIAVAILFAIHLGRLVKSHELQPFNHSPVISFKSYFSEDLFADIKKYLPEDRSQYRVVSLGMHPTIASWNGFYTLDFYSVMYPLEYKENFREIIAPELEKNEKMRKYFDGFGGRAYIFSSEVEVKFDGDHARSITTLDLNYDKLYAMGGRYLFSAVRIQNLPSRLKLLRTFEGSGSHWKIDVYEVLSIGGDVTKL